jgi:ubiquinone/menaquinone biosynthesis C-methylase UbiE
MDLPSLTALATAVLHVPDRPERILDIGCGDGDGVLFLAREFPLARVRGVDASEDAVRAAVSRTGLDPEGRVAFKRGSLRALPYPDGFFDLVTQLEGRLHAGEIARVLRPGGHLILVGSHRWREWRLAKHDLDPIEKGEADGRAFLVAQLEGDSE